MKSNIIQKDRPRGGPFMIMYSYISCEEDGGRNTCLDGLHLQKP